MSLRRLHALGKKAGLDHDGLHDLMRRAWPHRQSLSDLTVKEVNALCASLTRNPQAASHKPQARPRRVAPRGKKRPEGVIPLASGRQKGLIRTLLEKLLKQPNETLRGVEFVLQRIMGREWMEAVPAEQRTPRDYADAVQTGPDAQMLIRGLVGELKRRGVWH
jgi:hypothetical protein